MIIIGGKNSSNTHKLFEIANNKCKQALLIENAHQLNIIKLNNVSKIAIMAGASTPEKDIKEVYDALKKL